jgi:hypothetical protein
MNIPQSFQDPCVTFTVGAGVVIYSAIREGVAFAIEHDAVVRFKHNGREYVIHPKPILQSIFAQRDWRRKAEAV